LDTLAGSAGLLIKDASGDAIQRGGHFGRELQVIVELSGDYLRYSLEFPAVDFFDLGNDLIDEDASIIHLAGTDRPCGFSPVLGAAGALIPHSIRIAFFSFFSLFRG